MKINCNFCIVLYFVLYCSQVQKTARHHQLLRGVHGRSRHVGRHHGHVLQRLCPGQNVVDIIENIENLGIIVDKRLLKLYKIIIK